MTKLQALKTLVAGMGALLVIGTGVLVYGLITQFTGAENAEQSVVEQKDTVLSVPLGEKPSTARVADMGTLSLGLKDGEEIAEMSLDRGILAARVDRVGQGSIIYLIDIADGRVVGVVTP